MPGFEFTAEELEGLGDEDSPISNPFEFSAEELEDEDVPVRPESYAGANPEEEKGWIQDAYEGVTDAFGLNDAVGRAAQDLGLRPETSKNPNIPEKPTSLMHDVAKHGTEGLLYLAGATRGIPGIAAVGGIGNMLEEYGQGGNATDVATRGAVGAGVGAVSWGLGKLLPGAARGFQKGAEKVTGELLPPVVSKVANAVGLKGGGLGAAAKLASRIPPGAAGALTATAIDPVVALGSDPLRGGSNPLGDAYDAVKGAAGQVYDVLTDPNAASGGWDLLKKTFGVAPEPVEYPSLGSYTAALDTFPTAAEVSPLNDDTYGALDAMRAAYESPVMAAMPGLQKELRALLMADVNGEEINPADIAAMEFRLSEVPGLNYAHLDPRRQ